MIRRRRDRGQALLLPAYTVILVSRDDLPLDELVRRHLGKQGQENAFKGPLIDLDLHHPACRKFRANQTFYICDQLAQMLLRGVQYRRLPTRARRHGLRPLILYLIRVVARLVRNGRRWRLDCARNNFRLDWLYHAPVQLELLALTPSRSRSVLGQRRQARCCPVVCRIVAVPRPVDDSSPQSSVRRRASCNTRAAHPLPAILGSLTAMPTAYQGIEAGPKDT